MEAKCKLAKNVKIDGVSYKVIDPQDNCAVIQRVLARHQGLRILSPEEFKELTKKEVS
ncbi:unnamed protein product [marine sediment metagenome]|uniref:Uncharacterized protein n=1 Tax=marine sediment metagenome TaxID=412755 RepID=X1U734_9ZZZZ